MKSMFLRFPGGKSKALTFSYDDGIAQDKRLIEIFRRNGLKGTFNINSGLFANDDTIPPGGRERGRMSQTEVLAAYDEAVCELACHGLTHPYLNRCADGVLCSEIVDDRKNLEQLFGRQIRGMAYPYGAFNDTVVEALRLAGIRYCRTTVATEIFHMPTDWLRMSATCHHNCPRLMALADQFLALPAKRNPQVFYVWGHSYEFDNDNNWEMIEAFAAKMAGKDDIWYATNMEIYNAWHDFTQLEVSADGKQVFNPTARDVLFADTDDHAYHVAPGKTIWVD